MNDGGWIDVMMSKTMLKQRQREKIHHICAKYIRIRTHAIASATYTKKSKMSGIYFNFLSLFDLFMI